MAEVANKFNLDSTYFVAFEMAHEALRRGLEQASDLNITQYRILTKLMQASAPVSQGELGKILDMKPNVVTQAVDALVALGYATREAGAADGRTRFLAVTDAGAEHVAVREPAAGCQPLETRTIQTPREEIGHMNIPGYESGTQEGRSHFVL